MTCGSSSKFQKHAGMGFVAATFHFLGFWRVLNDHGMSSNLFRAEHAQCTHSPPRLKQMPHRQQWPATIPPRQYYSNIMQWPTTPLLTSHNGSCGSYSCRIVGICRRYNHYNAICIHTLQNTKGEPITIETIQTAPASHTRYLSSPAATTLHGKMQCFVLQLPPQTLRHLWWKVSHQSLTPKSRTKVWHHPAFFVFLCHVKSHTKVSHHPSLSVLLQVKVIRNSEDCFPTSFD